MGIGIAVWRETKELFSSLKKVDETLGAIMSDEEKQKEEVRSASSVVLFMRAKESLSGISSDELKRSRSGIRISVLKEAGYDTLGSLSDAPDHELLCLDGIGEKRLKAIRSAIASMAETISSRTALQINVNNPQEEEKALLLSCVKYHKGNVIRKDAAAPWNELHAFFINADKRYSIRNIFRWLFAGKAEKEEILALRDDMLEFFGSNEFVRAGNLMSQYAAIDGTGYEEAAEYYEKNAAGIYALLESAGEVKLDKKLLYNSIPDELADEIDSFEPDLTLFNGTLRRYQLFGVKYILHQKRVLLGDEMGLGKTVEAIASMCHIAAGKEKPYFLIVCPASVLINWCREISKFSAIKPYLIHGPLREDSLSEWKESGGAAVTNYETMGKILDEINNRMKLDMLVIDEAHYIKNRKALRTRNVRELNEEAERILMMTGTPIENSAIEMCSLIGYLRPEMEDEAREAVAISASEVFKEILSPVYLRRKREDVLTELPAIEEKQEWCPMTAEDREWYLKSLASGNFQAMRRVSFLQDDMNTSSKALRLIELCEDARDEGRKTVVYSFFRDTVDKAKKALGDLCGECITGSTPADERQKIIDGFSEGKSGSVLLAQIQAGGTGLNIQAASVVIFLEPQIKPSLTDQALSRVYRMGQVNNVLVYHLLIGDTVDEAVTDILMRKKAEFMEYADESAMAESMDRIIDSEWINQFMEEENRKYLPAVISQ